MDIRSIIRLSRIIINNVKSPLFAKKEKRNGIIKIKRKEVVYIAGRSKGLMEYDPGPLSSVEYFDEMAINNRIRMDMPIIM